MECRLLNRFFPLSDSLSPVFFWRVVRIDGWTSVCKSELWSKVFAWLENPDERSRYSSPEYALLCCDMASSLALSSVSIHSCIEFADDVALEEPVFGSSNTKCLSRCIFISLWFHL